MDIDIYPWSSIGKIGVTSLTLLLLGRCNWTGRVPYCRALPLRETKRFFPAGSIHFLLGYSRGEYRVHRIASRYTIPPTFDPSLYTYPLDPEKLVIGAPSDWAIVYVDEPFPADVKPLRLATATPAPGTSVMVGGYARERRHMITADPHCRVIEISSDKKLISFDCVTHMGDSGGPFLSGNDQGLILAVINLFLAEQNVTHYRNRLHMGAEPVTRSVVLKLLLAEEEMLGLTREQLVRIDRHIEKLRRIIDQQQKRIDRFKFIGGDNDRALVMLATLNDLMATYQLHRQRITAALADPLLS